MDRVAARLSTKSEKIRALGRAGFARGDIARYLGIRYQHVRNVLVHAEEREKGERTADVPVRQEWAQVGPDGRVVIPAPYRKLLGIDGGGPLLMLLDDGEVRLVGRDAAIRRAQSLVARYVPAGTSLADELIAERQTDAVREERG
jgi:AbrB family looped-hinge helix DNA binding protein